MKKKRLAIALLSIYMLSFFLIQLNILTPAQAASQPTITAVWNNTLHQVNVEWTNLPDAEARSNYVKYHLCYRKKGTTEWTNYMSVDWDSTGKGVTGISENTEYEFILRSLLSSAEDDGQLPSNIVSVTTKTAALGFEATWTGSDIRLDWRNAQVSLADGVRIWCKGPSDTKSYYIGNAICEERGSILLSSIINDNTSKPYVTPKKGETWTFGISDNDDNTSQATVSCWLSTEADSNGDYNADATTTSTTAATTENVLTDKGNIFERIIAGIINIPVSVIESIGTTVGFKEMDELIFSKDHDIAPWADQAQKDKIVKWFWKLMWATLPFFVFVIAYNAFNMMHSASNPMARAESMEAMQRWFFALGIIIIAPIFINLIMTISGLLTDAIAYAFTSITGGNTSIPLLNRNIVTGSVLGTAFVQCMFAMMYLYFNVIYMIRMVAISVMFAFTPLMAIMWAIKKDVTAASVWLGELASNAFMPVAHALVICTILILVNSSSWVEILIMLYCLIPLSEALRNSMMSVFTRAAGVNEQRVGMNALGAVMGLGGLISMSRVGGSMFSGSRMAKGGAMAFSKGTSSPQAMANITRKLPSQTVPETNFNKMNYGDIDGKGVYVKHNWDRKNPKPTAVKSPTPSSGRIFHYKQPDTLDNASVLNSSITAGKRAGYAVAAPAATVAGAVPGGIGMTAAMYAGTAGVTRGGATAAMLGRNVLRARKETGSTAQALNRVTGADTTRGAIKNIAGTVGGSIFQPTNTLNKALQDKKLAEQNRTAGIMAKKARLDARLNPIQLKASNQSPSPIKKTKVNVAPGTPGSTKPISHTSQSNTNRSYASSYREKPASNREFTKEQYKSMKLQSKFTPRHTPKD